MLVIPAIDIRDGRCVRLTQGDYARETVYADDPVAVAARWADMGAKWLHVVDLDGAVGQGPRNLPIVAQIVKQVPVSVQLGGGLKRRAHAEEALALGVERVVLGTAAVEDAGMVRELARLWGERLVVGIDARAGIVAVRGWRESAAVSALDLAARMEEMGVRRIIYTDIARDGMLSEPNYPALAELIAAVRIPVVASGGVSAIAQLRRLADIGAEAAIVGRALYTGHVDLSEALAAGGRSEG